MKEAVIPTAQFAPELAGMVSQDQNVKELGTGSGGGLGPAGGLARHVPARYFYIDRVIELR